MDKRGIAVDKQVCGDLKSIMEDGKKMMEEAKANSFQKIFWQQQIDASRGMRLHRLMIKWCIYLSYMSQVPMMHLDSPNAFY